jgi:exodeoxyribonuclease V alpha subunit
MIRGIGPVYAKKLVRAFGEADGRRCVFLAGLCRAEREIAAKLTTLAAGRPPWPLIDADKAIPWVEKRTKLALANSQQEAIRGALWSKVLVITGGPGVGKTTLVNSIPEIFLAKTVAIVLCAPTGRAAKRLSESTGLEAKTIHRLLETDPRTGLSAARGRPRSTAICSCRRDLNGRRAAHASSAARLARSGRIAARRRRRSIAFGGAGASAGRHHLVGCRAGRALDRGLPTGRREPHHRQRASRQQGSDARSRDFYFVEAADPEEGVRKLRAIVQERIPKRFGFDPIRDIQVLCPMNRGGLGARSLNIELQTALNPPGETRIERFGWTFCPGGKVMQVEDNYDKEVYNGDLGVVSRIDIEEGELNVDFDGREITYGFGELDELVLAYATTIHKSQGSEYPAVVIPLSTQHYPML